MNDEEEFDELDLIFDQLQISDAVMSHKEDGDAFLNQNDYERAVEEYEAALDGLVVETSDEESLQKEIAQGLVLSHKKAGESFFHQNNYERAVEEFKAALDGFIVGTSGNESLRKDITKSLVLSHAEAGMLLQQNNYERAVEEYEAALDGLVVETSGDELLHKGITQRLADLYLSLGYSSLSNSNFIGAISYFEKAGRLDPTNHQIRACLSMCYYRIDEYAKAKDAARTAIKSNPSGVEGYEMLGRVQKMLFEFNDAKETIGKGLAIDPDNSILLEVQSDVNGIVEMRSEYQSAVLQYPENGYYDFFGGLYQAQAANKIPVVSSYAGLHRPAKPRRFEKYWSDVLKEGRKNNERSSDELAQRRAMFSVFYNEDLPVKWSCNDSHFILEGYVPEDEVHPVLHCVFHNPGDLVGQFDFYMTTFQNQTFHTSMTYIDKERLRFALLSRFLRSMGSVLPKYWLLTCCDAVLRPLLIGFKLFDHVAEVDIVKCDVLINCHDCPMRHMYDFSESLSASCMYVEAGNLLCEIADGKFLHILSVPNDEKPEIHLMAAMSFHCGMSYVDAEREYLAHARELGPAIRDKFVSGFFQILLRLYSAANIAVLLRVVPRDKANMSLVRSYLLLGALVDNIGVSNISLPTMGVSDIVRPKFKSSQEAKKAFNDVFATKSVEDFHKLLFSYEKPNIDGTIFPQLTATREEFLSEQTQWAKEMTMQRLWNQKYDTSHLTWGATDPYCGNWSHCKRQNHSNFDTCRCRKIVYCSKECERAHWPIHREICSARKSKS